MSSRFADFVDGTPGRFVPAEMKGQLVEAEHLTRYWWAAGMAQGRRVLDAGCGMGYGAELMAQGGAASVAAIDVAEAVVEAARAAATAPVDFRVGDVRSLPFDDDSFDLVACFEVIEHVEEQDRALDEIRRVLAPGGVLLVSSPNRDVYMPGNPHHVHEYKPAELSEALRARWPNVALMRQHNLSAAVLLDDAAYAAAGGAAVEADVRKLVETPPGEEVYTVGMASDRELPTAPGLVTLASPAEIHAWFDRFGEQQRILEAQADFLAEVQQSGADREEALTLLAQAEGQLGDEVALRAQLRLADDSRRRLAEEVAQLREEVERNRRVLADMRSSLSWRITTPLRMAKRGLR